MSKPAAETASSCRLHGGGFRAALAILIILPSGVLAANPDPTLRRTDQVDLRRLGKVSADERSVLRIEWRAGLASVEQMRSIQDMLDELRRLETGIDDVGQLVRKMPARAPAIAAAVPVTAEAPDTDGYDLRLTVANTAALALVALWWFRRRKTATPTGTAPAVSHAGTSPDAAPSATALIMAPAAEASRGADSAAAPEQLAAAAATPGEATSDTDPDTAGETSGAATKPAPPASADALATARNPPQAAPTEAFRADETMVIDFSPKKADPEVVAHENAKPEAPRPVSPPEPPSAAQDPRKGNAEPTLQLAEIMLSMGLEHDAAQALIEYIETNPRLAVYHWLKLLGIYRKHGLQKEFTETAEKLRKHFNIQAEEWDKPATGETPMLEKFSRISEHVQKIWSQPEACIAYLRHLLEDNREGARAGFPQSVAEEILFLVEILNDDRA